MSDYKWVDMYGWAFAIWVAVGVVLGAVTGRWVICVVIGVVVGCISGAAMWRRARPGRRV
jgi:hypothetical protein